MAALHCHLGWRAPGGGQPRRRSPTSPARSCTDRAVLGTEEAEPSIKRAFPREGHGADGGGRSESSAENDQPVGDRVGEGQGAENCQEGGDGEEGESSEAGEEEGEGGAAVLSSRNDTGNELEGSMEPCVTV